MNILNMAIFALVTSITPGPVNFIAASSGAVFGYRKTVSYVFGATAGFVSMLFVAGMGILELVNVGAEIVSILRLAGSLLFLYISYKLMKGGSKRTGGSLNGLSPGLFEGVVLQWINPKAWIVALSGIAYFSGEWQEGRFDIAFFCALFFVICFFSISAWAVAGGALGQLLASPSYGKYFYYLMAAIMFVMAVIPVFDQL